MRLAQRIVVNSFVVATLLVGIVLFAVERRVTERVRAEEPTAAASAGLSQMLCSTRSMPSLSRPRRRLEQNPQPGRQ